MAHIDTVGRPVSWWERVKKFEPARVASILAALVIIVGTVGYDLTPYADKVNTAWAAFFAIIPLLQGEVIRRSVTPTSTVIEQVTPEGLVLAGPASPVETGTVLRHVDDNTTME